MAEVERRRKVRLVGGGKGQFLCIGKDNTCMKTSVTNLRCRSCNNGTESRGWLQDYAEDEHFIRNDRRMIRKGAQARRLCVGKDNTCVHLALSGELCIGCTKGPKPADDRRFKVSGNRNRPLCKGMDNTCTTFAKKAGYCLAHSD